MCDLDDFGVPVILHAADAIECRREEPNAKGFARMRFPSPDFPNAAELREAYVAGWMKRAERDVRL